MKVIVDYVTSSRRLADTDPSMHIGGSGSCSVCLGEDVGLNSYPQRAPHDPDICVRYKNENGELKINDSSNKTKSMFCPPRIWAFSLRFKSWRSVLPHELADVQQNEEPFNQLWTRNRKTLTLLQSTLVACMDKSQGGRSLDTMKGKGRGLNVLIHGNTGTGKTLTVGKLTPSELDHSSMEHALFIKATDK